MAYIEQRTLIKASWDAKNLEKNRSKLWCERANDRGESLARGCKHKDRVNVYVDIFGNIQDFQHYDYQLR